MKTNYLDQQLFRSKVIEDNINLNYHQSLETDISLILKGFKLPTEDLSSITDEELNKLLLDLFLKLSIKKSWRDLVKTGKVEKEELYLIVKKHIYFIQNNLI